MKSLPVTRVRNDLYRIVDDVAALHEPLQITGKRGSAVLVAQDDWDAVQETLYLLSVPGMRESIREGMDTPTSETSESLDW